MGERNEMSENIIMVNSNGLEWEDPPRGYYLTDVKQKVLWKDEEIGAQWVLMKWPVGVLDKKHTHPEANQYMFALEGEAELPNGVKVPIKNLFTYTKKELEHGETKLTKESLVLFYWDGPSRPEF